MQAELKWCGGCKSTLHIAMFSKHAKTKDGLQTQCRDCGHNRATNKDVRKKYYDANQSALLESKRNYYLDNKELLKFRQKQWEQANPEKRWAINAKRRAIQYAATVGPLPTDILSALIEFYGEKCMYPGCTNINLTVDHIVALANGGSHAMSNFQILCLPHNCSKKNLNSIDYRPKVRLV